MNDDAQKGCFLPWNFWLSPSFFPDERRRTPVKQPDEMDLALRRLYDAPAAPAGFESRWRAEVKREELRQMANETKQKHSGRVLWRAALSAAAALVLVIGGIAGMNYAPGASDSASDSAAPRVAVYDSSADFDAGYANEVEGAVGSSNGTALYSTKSASAGNLPATAETRKLVRSVSLTLSTDAFNQSLESVQSLLTGIGGYVENLYQYGDGQTGRKRGASLTLRVPTDRLDEFLSGITGIGRITERSESTTDMTVQYNDNAARLKTLNDKMARLNELMSQAQDVSDLIALESAIQETQYQLDSYETAQRDIDSRVDMSYVNVQLNEETSAQSAASSEVSLGQRILAALKATVTWMGSFGRGLLVFLAMALPVAAVLAVIGLVVWLIVRRVRRGKEG